MCRMVIRQPTIQDVDQLMRMCERMHQESVYSFLPFDSQKVRETIDSYLEQPGVYGSFVAEVDRELVGMVGGFVTDYFFSHEKMASDSVLFVEKPYRGTRAAVRLIQAFERWAIASGARELCLGISTGVDTERTRTLL